MTAQIVSAIPEHLRTERTCPFRHPEGFKPSYPTKVAYFSPSVDCLVMAYFGVQGVQDPTEDGLAQVARMFDHPRGPGHHDRAAYVDESGVPTQLRVAYWSSVEEFDSWQAESGFDAWWQHQDRLVEPVGYFLEVFTPKVENLEATLFSAPWEQEGVAVLAEEISGEIREHSYWGGVYDRIPSTQTEWLKPVGDPRIEAVDGDERRLRVIPADNLAIIRSGQNWTNTVDDELDLCVNTLEPVLREGMNFLRDDGLPIGCYTDRYVTVLDEKGEELKKTYGLALFRSLDDMAFWAANHPTHMRLFETFMDVVQKMNFELDTTFYHEVAVLGADQQRFEYLNCHPRTGMLRTGLGIGYARA